MGAVLCCQCRKKSTSTSPTKSEADNASTLPSTWCPPSQYVKAKSDLDSRRKTSLPKSAQDTTSDDSEQITCRRSLDYSAYSNFPLISNRSSSADELENRSETVVLRRKYNFNSLSEVPILRHSFHREPHQHVERDYRQDRRFSSLEGDRERRLLEWERKKFEREKRHSEGNLPAYLSSKYRTGTGSLFNINSQGNVLKQIKKYERKLTGSAAIVQSSSELSNDNSKIKKSCEKLKIDIGEELMRKKEQDEAEKKRRERLDQERRQKEEEDLQKKISEQDTRRQDSERRQKERDLLDRLRKEEEHAKLKKRTEQQNAKRKENENFQKSFAQVEITRTSKERESFEMRRERESERRLKEQEILQQRVKEQEEKDRKKHDEEKDKQIFQQKEFERRRKEQEDNDRRRKELEEIERRSREVEHERKRKEQEDKDFKRKEQEEIDRRLKEKEENERRRKELEEIERRRKELEEINNRRKEQEEIETKRKEQQEIENKRKQEEIEKRRKEQEEIDKRLKEQEELEKKLKEQEELQRKEQEELEMRLREQKEIEKRRREQEEKEKLHREQEELERKRKEQDEIERKRKEQEEIERKRKEQEIERQRKEQEEIERKRKEQEEIERRRKEQEEIERKRKEQEEIERKRKQQEEIERIRKEQEEIERIRKEQEEIERKRKEQEEIEKILKEREELERKRKEQEEIERKQKEQEKMERKRKEQEEIVRKRKEQEQLDRKRIEREAETKRKEIEEYERNRRDQEERERKKKDKEEMERRLMQQAEVERKRKEQDEIERIFEQRENAQGDIKRVYENYSKSEFDATVSIMNTSIPVESGRRTDEFTEAVNEALLECKDKRIDYEQTVESPFKYYRPFADISDEEKLRREKDRQEILRTKQRLAELKKEREDIRRKQMVQMQQLLCSTEDKSDNVCDIKDKLAEEEMKPVSTESKEEIIYDHTVLSAQHKIELGASIDPHFDDHESPYHTKYATSTISSNFEPLPPPIPPHNVDPASLMSSMELAEETEPMTPEEEKKFLSSKTDGNILSDKEANEASRILDRDYKISDQDVIETRDEDKFQDSLEPETQPSEKPLTASEEADKEGRVIRAQEVLVEDGVHYLEDGHFWTEIPGLTEYDEDDELSPSIPYHKHTKLKFSVDPIKLFSTHSITEYDRKNEDVDPVAASAEYELEKRVEKMDVYPVQIEKGDSGLGLSIIGMGVGADAGVEKLGIFVKTISPGGVTEKDGRIQVNDQIIEVDGKSLVGVTQMFAASVLKNTAGIVNFVIGREKDPENSEVAALIRQSLQADIEREERRRALEGPEFDPNNAGVFFDSLSSTSEDPSPLDTQQSQFEHYDDLNEGRLIDKDLEASLTNRFMHHLDESPLASSEIMLLRHHLQEAQQTNDMYEEELNILRSKLGELEKEAIEKEEISRKVQDMTVKLKEAEEKLHSRQAEITKYKELLEQSQSQFVTMEKKYQKAKKIIKEYQSRERDFLHREDYHVAQLEEKDIHYNSLVKALKDRVIQLESDLMKVQKSTGLPIKLPSAGLSNLPPSPRHSMKEPPNLPQALKIFDPELSDSELGEVPYSESSKSSTVERKVQPNEDLDVAIPPHALLDVSASKAKGELASRGGLANRQLPSLKKSPSLSSAGSIERSLEDSIEESHTESSKSVHSSSTKSHIRQEVFHYSSTSQSTSAFSQAPTSTPNRPPPPYHPPPSAPLSQRPFQNEWMTYESRDFPHRHPPPIARVQPVNRVEGVNYVTSSVYEHKTENQQRLADQLKAVLAEREAAGEISVSNSSESQIKKSHSALMEDVRQAVIQADASIGKKPLISGPVNISPQQVSTGPVMQTSTQKLSSSSIHQRLSREIASWSPQGSNSGASYPECKMDDAGVVLISQRNFDSSLPVSNRDSVEEPVSPSVDSISRTSFETSNHTTPVCDWTKEQVGHWLMLQGLESCISKFMSSEITGPRLINLDTKDLKNLGLTNDEKNRIKKKVKDLRGNVEKERKQAEKEKKEKEKLQKKAEKLAEKAEKKKK